mgnify:FL=1
MRRAFCLLVISFLLSAVPSAIAQQRYTLDVRQAHVDVRRGHLRMGGSNPRGDTIGANSFYLEYNGRPWFPLVGEFHYVRYPSASWDEELRKMKAGGIQVVATYVFWLIHEETEGHFDWTGNRNLRHFLELVAKNGLWAIVRVGPFIHAEIRNGGLPDWLYGRPFRVRSNDPEYLAYVARYYREIARQLGGLYFKDGGPIIAIQLENEYEHSAAPWAFSYPGQPPEWTASASDPGVPGSEHMRRLKQLAREAGMEAPLYTATGWGNAAIAPLETLPVNSAYPYPTWAPIQPSPLYLFRNLQQTPDYAPVSYDPSLYPVLGAELFGGIQVTYTRRPTIPPRSLEAQIVRQLGSGANGIGYYMYHGGATPRGRFFYFSDEAIGVPRINYDFQAPIGQYGQLRPSFHYLKLLHFFLQDYGARLAPMAVVLPETATQLRPTTTDTLRYAARSDGTGGFLFMHNFQDHVALHDLTDLQLIVYTRRDTLVIPRAGTFTLKAEASAILPFNLPIGDLWLRYATAQPLAVLHVRDTLHHAFVALEGIPPEFAFAQATLRALDPGDCQLDPTPATAYVRCPTDRPATFSVIDQSGRPLVFALFPKQMALSAWRLRLDDGSYLAFSEATLLEHDTLHELQLEDTSAVTLALYPKRLRPPRVRPGTVSATAPPHPALSAYRVTVPAVRPEVQVERVRRDRLVLRVGQERLPEPLHEVFVDIDYVGDTGMAFIDGQLVDDHFYYGRPWRIGLKRFWSRLARHEMYCYFRPLYPDAPFLDDLPPEAIPDNLRDPEQTLQIRTIRIVPVFRTYVAF